MNAGDSIGTYRVLEKLGEGGMGEVYRAHDLRLGRDVALKILPADVSSDPSRLDRFTREARTIAALNHPHIVTIYSTEEIDGVRFFTMELVEGQTLDVLIADGRMLLSRFLELALQLADALTAAHQKGITHRDLKPGNVIVTPDGRVKVLDFGLAKAVTPAGGERARHASPLHDLDLTAPPMTTPGMIVGTMPYMSPEQIEGRALDHRSDLFSLGVMFHEMLTGSRPFAGESSPQLMSSILRDVPASISDVRADMPEALSRLVGRCLEKRPDDRVQTARDIYNELRHLQKQIESGSTRRSSERSVVRIAPDRFWIAVLPFTAAGDASAKALAEGLTEDITAGLSRFSSLSVLAQHSVREAAGSGADKQRIAERLSARYVIAGSVRQSGTSLRISAHLVDASSGTQLWSEAYQRDTSSSDVFAVQDDVCDRVVATVADRCGVLVRSMVQTLQHLPPDQLSVRDLVLRCHMFHQVLTPEQHAAYRSALEHALAADARHPEAWATLANLYFAEYGFWLNPRPEPLARARRAAERALDLDASTQGAWEVLAAVAFFERDEDGLATAVERAIALNPRNSNTLAWMGLLLMQAGAEQDRGTALIERAMAINPHHPGWYHYGPFKRHFKRGEYAEALRAARRVNMPELPDTHWAIAAAAGQLGRHSEARGAIDAIRRLAPQLLDRDPLHEFTARWHWEADLVQRLVEGVMRAQALASSLDAPAKPGAPAARVERDGVALSPGIAGSQTIRPRSDPSAAPRHDLSIAVLPFIARSSDEESTALAEGLTDDITAGLAKFVWLSVVSRASTERMKAVTADIKTIGVELNARYVIEGTVRKAGGTVRVSARLVDVDSGAHLWAENYDRDLASGTFALQDDLASRIVATVADANGVLMRTRSADLVNKPLDQLTVPELCDRVQWYAEHLRPEMHAEFRAAFESAVEREPTNPRAWALLALFYAHEILLRHNPLPDSAGRTRRAAERAMTLAANTQQTWVANALAALLAHDLTALRLAAERTVALNPFNTRSVATVGLLLAFAGDYEAGAGLVRRAVALNPNHPGWYHLVLFFDHFCKGEDEAALQEAKAISMPGFVWSHLSSIAAAGQLGRAAEAIPAVDGLRRNYADLLDRDRAREAWASALWDEVLVARLMDGFDKALELRAGSGFSRGDPPSDAGKRASIAVLLFTDLSATKDQEWFCDGIAEEILNALTQLPGLHVAARTSAFSFRGKENELRDIADKLKVSTVLQGSVRRAGDRVRITVQLVDVTSGFQLWSERYDREARDIFDIQDEIARAVAGRLRVTLSGGAHQRLVARHSANVQAYELYLKGRGLLYQRGSGIRPALACFQQAVALDPEYALAWAGIGDAYAVMAYFGVVRGEEARRHGLPAARRALELDAQSAEAYTALATMTLLVEGDRAAAERAFLRALDLNPAYIQARCWYAVFYLQWTVGRMAEGVEEARKALLIDPMSAYVWMVICAVEGTAGHDDLATDAGRRAVALDPHSFVAQWALGTALSHGGHAEEGLEVLRHAADMSNRHAYALATMALTYSRLGKRELAQAIRQELEQRSTTQYVPAAQLALCAEAAGDREAAITLAQRAWKDREPPFLAFARYFSDFRTLHDDPRFMAIIAEMDAT